MGNVKTKGIIIAENNLNDYDKMLTILTPGLGKIGCIAKGARKTKSLLLAGTQFLCFGEYLLYKTGEIYSMNSCDIIEIFYSLRTDFEKLRYAVHITKIISEVTTENQNVYKILRLYLNTLYVISEKQMDLEFVLAIFKLRLIAILGFMPNVKDCKDCKSVEKLTCFSIKDNSFKCQTCSKQDTSCIKIEEGTKDAIRYSILAPSEKLYSFEIPENCKKELELISKIYFDTKLEKEYKMDTF